MSVTRPVRTILWLSRRWEVIVRDHQYFVVDDHGAETGPFSSYWDARTWVLGIRLS